MQHGVHLPSFTLHNNCALLTLINLSAGMARGRDRHKLTDLGLVFGILSPLHSLLEHWRLLAALFLLASSLACQIVSMNPHL